MPALDKPLAELRAYYGSSPLPADFDAYWSRALAELDDTPPQAVLTPNSMLRARGVETFDLTFTGVGGARVYAKYLRPEQPTPPCPALLQFHGYAGNSGEWVDKAAFVAEGFAVAAMDTRGQGGLSEDVGGVTGNTLNGHIIRGLAQGADALLFRNIFLDTVQLARVVAGLPEVDASRLSCMGASQGGALSIACAALEPRIRRCVSVYPFLSDYQRVWDMDLDKDAYAELRTYLRNFDPMGKNRKQIFETLGYIDIQNLASRISADVLMAITLMDNICPPSSQFAVYNKIKSQKEVVIFPDHGHEVLPGFRDLEFNFLAKAKIFP